MINDVKIFDGNGNLKQIISGEKLRLKHWHEFKKSGDLKINHDRGIKRNINRAKSRKKST